MAKGCILSGEDHVISVEKNEIKFLFNHQVRSGQGNLLGIKINSTDTTNSVTIGKKKSQ